MNSRGSVVHRTIKSGVKWGLIAGVAALVIVYVSLSCANNAKSDGAGLACISVALPVYALDGLLVELIWPLYGPPPTTLELLIVTGIVWFVVFFIIGGVNSLPPRPILTWRAILRGLIFLLFGYMAVLLLGSVAWSFGLSLPGSLPGWSLWVGAAMGFLLGIFVEYFRTA